MQTNASDLPITPELLGLSDIKIDNIRTTSDGSIHIKVSSTKQEVLCRICRCPTSPHGVGRPFVYAICHYWVVKFIINYPVASRRGISKPT